MRRGVLTWCVTVATVFAGTNEAGAQSACSWVAASHAPWGAPLNKQVTLGTGTVSLADALERLAKAADVHLTYSSDLLPPARTVCLGGAKVHVGDALEWWLAGTGLSPVVLASDRVVLVPRRPEAPTGVPLLSATTARLDRVEVRDTPEDESPGIVGTRTVLTTPDLESFGGASIAEALSATVPGMWTWATAPTAISSGQTTARGASSFGAASPKVYVDGVEVANPLLLSQLSVDRVARIEVIRGPQGSALFGSGAIGGVIRVTTRQALAAPSERSFSVRSMAGVAASEYAPLGVLVQEHAVNGHAGDGRRSVGASVATGTIGEFVPGAFNRQVQASIGASVLGQRTRLQLTGQFLQQRVGSSLSPAVSLFATAARQPTPRKGGADSLASATAPIELSPSQSSREVTVGATLSVQGKRAVHTFVAGFDGYRLTSDDAFLRTTGDSLLQAATGSAGRASLSWNSVQRFGSSPDLSGTMTFGVEHTSLHDATIGPAEAGRPVTTVDGSGVWRHATGALASTQVRLFQSLVLSGGLRFERHEGFTVFSGNALLPTVGAAWQHQRGPVGMTVRAGYGKAMQPPRVGSRADVLGGRIPSVFTLMPEEQSGYELGADVRLGAAFSLSVTRFDQLASNLIQRVGGAAPGSRGNSPLAVVYDNVGAIANQGWEVESRAAVGRLSLTGALGLTDSRVRRVASTYRGDLRAGDRVLQIPARTYSLGARWAGDRWGTSLLLARAADWVNYDWVALTAASDAVRGQALRSYWADYGGVSRVRASLHRDLTGSISLVASGENLLGLQRGEPDNVTIVPGRTLRIGLRAGAR